MASRLTNTSTLTRLTSEEFNFGFEKVLTSLKDEIRKKKLYVNNTFSVDFNLYDFINKHNCSIDMANELRTLTWEKKYLE